MHAHEPLIEGWLRSRPEFSGLVVSDYTGIKELTAHGIGAPPTAAARALHAGIDMDMVGEDYLQYLPALVEDGLDAPECGVCFSAAEIRALVDRACRNVLAFKAQLGLLDDPFRGLDGAVPAPARDVARGLARRAASASAVLLKNDGVLPLAKSARVALIGPLAADRANMLGTWSVAGDAADVVTLSEAVAAVTGRAPVTVAGSNLVDETWLAERLNVHGITVERDPRRETEMLAEAVDAARAADVVVLAVGEAKEHAGESELAPVAGPARPAAPAGRRACRDRHAHRRAGLRRTASGDR